MIKKCESCSRPISEINTSFRCDICDRIFCSLCPPIHIPPAHKVLEVQIDYNCSQKFSDKWESKTVRFTENLPSPLCNQCYLEEFGETSSILQAKVKDWKIDMLSKFNIDIIKEVYPVIDGESMTVKYEDIINQATHIVTCPSCNSMVRVPTSNEQTKCKICGHTIADSTINITKNDENTLTVNRDVCEVCHNPITEMNNRYICEVCKKSFCMLCERPHIPPEEPKLEFKVEYEYRVKPSVTWRPDVIRFTHSLPSVLCRNCYTSEFDKGVEKLKLMFKNWKIDMVRENDIRVTKEIYPEAPQKTKYKVVESAYELLKKIGKM